MLVDKPTAYLWIVLKGLTVMENMLQANPEIGTWWVVGEWDENGLGAIQASRQAGKTGEKFKLLVWWNRWIDSCHFEKLENLSANGKQRNNLKKWVCRCGQAAILENQFAGKEVEKSIASTIELIKVTNKKIECIV